MFEQGGQIGVIGQGLYLFQGISQIILEGGGANSKDCLLFASDPGQTAFHEKVSRPRPHPQDEQQHGQKCSPKAADCGAIRQQAKWPFQG